jgi:hypothetical protein
MNVCTPALNNFHDACEHREAKTLAAAGNDANDAAVVAVWQAGLAREETRDSYRVIRLPPRSQAFRGGDRCATRQLPRIHDAGKKARCARS